LRVDFGEAVMTDVAAAVLWGAIALTLIGLLIVISTKASGSRRRRSGDGAYPFGVDAGGGCKPGGDCDGGGDGGGD
jgi:hypothetical protein